MKRLIFVLITVLIVSSAALADEFPNKPITLIIPSRAGGGFDKSSRVVAAGWEKTLGQPIKFKYLPGASGQIGFNEIMNNPSDGYTIIMTTIAMQAMNINVGISKFSWDQIGFIGNLIVDPNVILVHKDSPWETINDFIKAGKKAQEPLTISTSHPKAVSTLAAKIFIELTGINGKVVAFDGGSAARNALAGKHVDACVGPYFSSSSKKEFIKALASFTDEKVWPGIWDVPTLSKATGKQFPNLVEPFAFMIKRDTITKSPEAYKKLVETFEQAIASKETQEMAKKTGMTAFIEYWSPEKCDAYVESFQSVWNKYKHLME
ncbi:tripartite tricarboxylate transporter substrate binding protein [Candidatus Aerophobetes bacterium]|nr:tripartite tricarboxylate transporter substrate binding protein [Candidatus Aerophobetes bacterium]